MESVSDGAGFEHDLEPEDVLEQIGLVGQGHLFDAHIRHIAEADEELALAHPGGQASHALGMVTGWVNNGSERGDHGHSPDFIDHEMHDLTDWLEDLTT